MQNTGDGADYREMSPGCPNCLEYADYIEGIWDCRGLREDGRVVHQSARTSKQTSQGQIDVTLTIEAAPTEMWRPRENAFSITLVAERTTL